MRDLLLLIGSLDLFGARPNLSWQGKYKSFSYCGLFVSVIAVAVIMALFGLFSKNMIHHTNPYYTQSLLNAGAEFEKHLFNNDRFPLSFGVANLATQKFYLNPSLFTFQASYIYYNASGVMDSKPLEMELCTDDPTDQQNYNAYCFKKKQSAINDIYLMSGFQAFIQLNFVKCDNTTSNITCATPEVIETYLGYSICSTFYSVWAIDPSNYLQPMTKVVKNNWTPIVNSFSKTLALYLMEVQFTSDNGWLTTNEHTQQMLNPDSLYFDFNNVLPNVFFTAIIQMSGNKMVYKRHYDKIQDVMAKVSGMMGTIMILLGIFVIPYSRTKMFEPLINSIYEIRMTQGQNPKGAKIEMGSSIAPQYKIAGSNDIHKVSPDYGDNSFNMSLRNKALNDLSIIHKPENQGYRPTASTLDIQPNKLHENTAVQPSIMLQSKRTVSNQIEERGTREIPHNNRVSILSNNRANENLLYQKSPFLSTSSQSSKPSNARKLSDNRDPNSPDLYAEEIDSSIGQIKLGEDMNSSQLALNRQPFDRKYTALSIFPQNYNTKDPKLEITMSPDKSISPDNVHVQTKSLHSLNNQNPNSPPSNVHDDTDKVRTNYFWWIKSLFVHQKEKRIIDLGTEEIMKSIDILSILKRFREIDNLKKCLLSPSQRVLFDNIPRPQMIVNPHLEAGKEDYVQLNNWIESYEGDDKKMQAAYEEIKSREHKSDVDKQILQLYERNSKTKLK